MTRAIHITEARTALARKLATSRSKSSRNGSKSEDMLSARHEYSERQGTAMVRQVGPPIRITGNRGGQITGRLLGHSTTDYVGVLGDGRALFIEAKSFEPAAKLPRVPFSRIQPHQSRDLTRCQMFGGCALLVIIVGPLLYSVPWRAVNEVRANGAASLAPLDYERWQCKGRDYLARELEETT